MFAKGVFFLLVIGFGVVLNNPLCLNWCQLGFAYTCCDHLYPTAPNYGYHPQLQVLPSRFGLLCCPLIPSCAAFNRTSNATKECGNDSECSRKEMCCVNPCQEGKMMCLNGTTIQTRQSVLCPGIDDCREWTMKNETQTKCEDNSVCLRSHTCCINPCVGHKTCQKSRFYTDSYTEPYWPH